MKTALPLLTARAFRASFPAIAFVLASATLSLQADAPLAPTVIRPTGTDAEGRETFSIEWNAASNLLYRIETRSGFESNTTWTLYDVVRPGDARGSYSISGANHTLESVTAARRGFFRVLEPQTEIFQVEPAVLGTNGGTVNLFGQCFSTNFTVRVGGLVLSPNVLQPGSAYSFTLAPGALGEGFHDVEILDGTNVLALAAERFSISTQPNPLGAGSGSFARLLEVPEEPFASPVTPDLLFLKAKEKANRTRCGSNLRTMPSGEVILEEVDLVIPGRGLDFIWARTYRSRTGPATTMGQGWSHSYDIRCAVDTAGNVGVRDGTGRADSYLAQTDGGYTADELFNVGSLSNGVFTLKFPDTGVWEFHSLSNTIAPGRIARIADRHGNQLTFTYDGSHRLTEIIDTLGRTNRLAYDPVGRVRTLTDFSGRIFTYTYYREQDAGGSEGDLQSCTTPPVVGTPNTNDFPLGKTTAYTYSEGLPDARLNRNLLSITDAKNQVCVSLSYHPTTDPADVNYDRVAAVQRGVNPPALYTYVPQTPAASNRWAVLKVLCNDPVGNVTIDWFDSLNRNIIHRDLAARATAGTPLTEATLPTVKLRDSDPDYWETTYEWTPDSLCSRVTYPGSNSVEVVHQRAACYNSSRSNKTSRHSDGNPIVVHAVSRRVIGPDMEPDLLTLRATFHQEFGPSRPQRRTGRTYQNQTDKDIISRHIQLPADQSGDVIIAADFPGSGINEKMPDTWLHFATRVVDSRGSVTECLYGSEGTRIRVIRSGLGVQGAASPVTEFEYDAFGQLTACVLAADATGHRRRDELAWSNGRITQVTQDTTASAHVLQIVRDGLGRPIETVDPKSNTNQFILNALDQVMKKSSIIHCAGCSAITEEFSYDANDNLVRLELSNQDHTGALDTNNPSWTTLYTYDLLNRRTLLAHELTHIAQQRFATNRLVYDANDNVIEEHSPEAVSGAQIANYVACTYDTRDRLFTRTRAPGTGVSSTDTFDYDESGNLVRAVSGSGGGSGGSVWIQAFDGFNRCVSATDPLGNVTTYAYDQYGNLVYQRLDGQTNDVPGSAGNRRLSEVRYEYDGLQRLTAQRVSFFDIFTEAALTDGESTTTYAYAPNGAVRSITDDNGHVTRYSRDTKGRLSTVTDAKTNLTTYLYDANDNVTQVKQLDRSDAAGTTQEFTTTFLYDELDRCVVESDNVGNLNQYAYDSRGNLVRHTDPRGVLRGWRYDGLNRAIVIEADLDGDGEFDPISDLGMSRMFDDNSRLVASSDANSNITFYAYDALDRHIATTNADGTTRKLIWSPRSNLVQTEDANGTVVSNSFDLLDRCVRRDITPAEGVSDATTFELFTYDGASRLVQASNNLSMIDFSHDSLGQRKGGKQDCIAVAAVFDGVGNRLSLSYPTGGVVQWTYDALDQPATVSRTAGGLTTVLAATAYEGPGRVGRFARGNGINTRTTWNGMKNPPNAGGDLGWRQVALVNHQVAGGGDFIDRRAATYDAAQNKTQRRQTTPFATGVPALTTNVMGYDALNRMTSYGRNRASQASTKSMALDKNGNRLTVSSNGVVATYTMDAGTPEPADFQMNLYTVTPFGTQSHDRNGNRVALNSPAGQMLYTYDFADRLVLVQRLEGFDPVPVVSFTYDALGRRLSKTVYPNAPALPVTTQFILDPDSDEDVILEERVNGVAQAFAVWPHMHQRGNGVRISPSGETLYTHSDELGTAVALTDAGGNVVERYDYDEFGAPRFFDAAGVPLVNPMGQPATASLAGNHYLFQGHFWDGETGLYLSPETSSSVGPVRWMAPESIRSRTYHDPLTGDELTHVHGDPHVDQKDGSRWDRHAGGSSGHNPWSAKVVEKATSGLKDTLKTQVRMAGSHEDTYVWCCCNRKTCKRCYPKKKSGAFGGGEVDIVSAQYNPKELQIDKGGGKGGKLKKEEGGRHTPFHNKYRPTQRTSFAVLLGSGGGNCDSVQNNPLYEGQGSKHQNPYFKENGMSGEMPEPAGLSGPTITVKLINPIAMDKGLRFSVRGPGGGCPSSTPVRCGKTSHF